MVVLARRAGAAAGIVAVAIAVAGPAHAAPSANVLDQVVAQFKAATGGWGASLQGLAFASFSILALIELAFGAFRLAFRGADLGEWLAELVNQILFLGFFLLLLQSSVAWMTDIVQSFRQAAGAVGATAIAPSDVFACGIQIAAVVITQMSIFSPAASAGFMIAGIVIEVCFALIAACMVLALVESYIVIQSGVLFMAFGGSRWTKDIAISTVRYAVSVGAKLFIVQLLAAIGVNIMQGWAALNTIQPLSNTDICVLIGCSIVMLALVKVVPDTVQKMINGASMAHGGALIGAGAGVVAGGAALAGGTASLGASLAGGVGMGVQALRLGAAQMGAADRAAVAAAQAAGTTSPGRSALGKVGAVAGNALGNLASAPFAEVGRRLSGQGPRQGFATWRMAADMGNQARLLNGDGGKPPPPGGGGDGGGGPGGFAGFASEAWMMGTGGFDELSADQQESARQSYARWEETNPEAAAKHDLEDYVAYVQEKQSELMAQTIGVGRGNRRSPS